jgi:hypothetical protein
MELETLLETFLRQKQLKPPQGSCRSFISCCMSWKTVAGDLETPYPPIPFLPQAPSRVDENSSSLTLFLPR